MAASPRDATAGAGALLPAPRPELAEVLAARLCHDLAGLVGTIGGMLDLVAEAPEEGAEAVPLAREAAAALRRRLRLLRAAWGPDTDDINLAEMGHAAADARLRVQVEPAAIQAAHRPGEKRLLLNVILLGVESLRGAGGLTLRLVAHAEGAAVGAARLLAAELAAAPARQVPCWPRTDAEMDAETDAAGNAAIHVVDPRHFQAAWTARLADECRASLGAAGPCLHIRLPT